MNVVPEAVGDTSEIGSVMTKLPSKGPKKGDPSARPSFSVDIGPPPCKRERSSIVSDHCDHDDHQYMDDTKEDMGVDTKDTKDTKTDPHPPVSMMMVSDPNDGDHDVPKTMLYETPCMKDPSETTLNAISDSNQHDDSTTTTTTTTTSTSISTTTCPSITTIFSFGETDDDDGDMDTSFNMNNVKDLKRKMMEYYREPFLGNEENMLILSFKEICKIIIGHKQYMEKRFSWKPEEEEEERLMNQFHLIYDDTIPSNTKIVEKYHDEQNSTIIFYKITQNSGVELSFLETMKKKIQHGDGYGYPMILQKDTKMEKRRKRGKETEIVYYQYVLSDCGISLNDVLSQHKPYDIQDMTLCFVSLFVSLLPAYHLDNHPGNFCIYHHDIEFVYTWTLKLFDVHYFEISWKSNGLLTCIDWDKHHLHSKLYERTLSMEGFDSFIMENFRHIIFDFEYLPMLLERLIKFFDRSKYSIKYWNNPSSSSTTTTAETTSSSSTIQVYPSRQYMNSLLQSERKEVKKFTRSTSSQHLKMKDDDEKRMKSFYESVLEHASNVINQFDFIQIPSDTGLVHLSINPDDHRHGLILVASCFIPRNKIVTSIPCTSSCNMMPQDHQMYINKNGSTTTRLIALKKLIPFVGLGSFARIGGKRQGNCIVEMKNDIIYLKSCKEILFGQEVIIQSSSQIGYNTSTGIIDDFNIILDIVKNL